jgi:hypothetical protein
MATSASDFARFISEMDDVFHFGNAKYFHKKRMRRLRTESLVMSIHR